MKYIFVRMVIVRTVSAAHELQHYMSLLKFNGTIVQLGLVKQPHTINNMSMIMPRKTVSASHIGGIKATEECLELCNKAGILPDTEIITADKIDWAY